MNIKYKVILLINMLIFVCQVQFTMAQESGGVFEGYVFHQDGIPFKNASVTVKMGKLSKQVVTDSIGYYKIENPQGTILEISFPKHYTKVVFPMAGQTEKTYLLKESEYSDERTYSNMISDRKLRHQNGAISYIAPEDYSTETNTVDDIWRNNISGVYTERQSGAPGAGSFSLIRGIHSLHTNQAPVVVVDGVYLGNYDFNDPAIYGNDIFMLLGINPENVKEIIFLKDGVSTLKYGVKGGNGVILINTKRAEVSKTQISVNASGGISFYNKEIPMMNIPENREYLQEQLFSKGYTVEDINNKYPFLGPDANAEEYPKWNQNTNWQEEVFKPAFDKKVNFAFGGGDEISKFYFSLGYNGKQGVIKNTKMDKLNARLNADVGVSEKLDLKVNLGFAYAGSNLLDQGPYYVSNPMYAALIKSPSLGIYEPVGGGRYLSNLDPEDEFEFSNPMGITNTSEESRKNYFLVGSFRFNYQINDHLYANMMIGNNLNQVNDNVFIHDEAIGRYLGSEAKQDKRLKNSKTLSWYTNNEIGYSNLWKNKHAIDLALGMNLNSNKFTVGEGSVLNTGADDFPSIQFGDVATRRKGGSWVIDHWVNEYFTADYNYMQKYFVEGGLSLDGSSRFGTDIEGSKVKIGNSNYALLPSISLGWDIAREPWIVGDLFDMFKLRGSYSLRGNDLFNSFIAKSYYVPVQFYDITGLVRGGVMNNGISWETSQNIELGLDASLIKEKVNLSVSYFNERVKDVVSRNKLDVYYGFNTMLDNSGEINMQGMEGVFRANVINTKKFSWETELNITGSESKIKKLVNDEIVSIEGGEKINRKDEAPYSFYGWKYKGVFATDQEAASAGLKDEYGRSFSAGDAIFDDSNHDGIIDDKDKQVIGNAIPDVWGGFVNRFRYGNFRLYTKISFNYGKDVYNYSREQLESGKNFFNQSKHALNAWTVQGDKTDVPKWQYDDPMGNARFSSRWIEDASFIRLDDVTLSYQFPLQNKTIKGMELYITGQNLLVLTDYLGYDPEMSYGMDVTTMGVDYFSAPINKSCIVGVKIDF